MLWESALAALPGGREVWITAWLYLLEGHMGGHGGCGGRRDSNDGERRSDAVN